MNRPGFYVALLCAVLCWLSCSEDRPRNESSSSAQPREITSEQQKATKPDTIALSGQGQQASEKFHLRKGLTVFHLKHAGSSNFAVILLDHNGEFVELLANDIGPFDGSKAVRVPSDGTYLLDITADGSWTITTEQ